MNTNNLTLSDNGKDFIQGHEGKINSVYIDPVGFATIGFGHLVKAGETFNHTLTDREVYNLFDNDIKQFEKGINNLVTVKLNQNQFDALVSFAFNLGLGALQSSTLLRVLNAGDYKEASKQFLRWDKADGKKLPGLTRRRKEESELFSGVIESDNDYENHWSKDNIEWALDNNIIKGYSGGKVKPNGMVTRAEVVTMLRNFYNQFIAE
jgi:lysozyme